MNTRNILKLDDHGNTHRMRLKGLGVLHFLNWMLLQTLIPRLTSEKVSICLTVKWSYMFQSTDRPHHFTYH